MKRFHVYAHVEDLQARIAFYSKLFAAEPARVETDYAKWMIEDPRINFAISTRGGKPGVDHLGFQTDSEEELTEMKERAQAADMPLLDEGDDLLLRAQRKALGHRPAWHPVGALPHLGEHPNLQPGGARASNGGQSVLRNVGTAWQRRRHPGEASVVVLLRTDHG